jgi:FixJ family two-component response regulator
MTCILIGRNATFLDGKVVVKQTSLLILDDNSSFAESLSDVLARSGFACRWRSRPAEALKLAAIAAPDVLLVDVNLGTVSGIEVAQKLCRTNRSMGVVFMTGSIDLDQSQIPEDFRSRSVVLHKPVDKETLVNAIASVSVKVSESASSED